MNLKKTFLCFTVCILISFLIGYIHYSCFYPLEFDGDAAAHHVLAKAMIDEGRFLPKDFAYGNQLIFFRSSPFIALAMVMGLKGYSAFIIGSSVSVAFWGGILYLVLAEITESGLKTVILSSCILIPLGHWEMCLVLGMQSHLANAVLSLACFVLLWKYIQSYQLRYLVFSNLCFFLITVEAPIRGMLIALPLYIVVIITTTNFEKVSIAITSTLTGSLFCAFFLNKIFLHYRPLRLNHFQTLKFRSVDEIIANLGITSLETMRSVSNLYVFSNESITFYKSCLYAIGLLIVFIYLTAILSGGVRLKQLAVIKLGNALQKGSVSTYVGCIDFLLLGGVAGCCIGALAVAALNPDSSRHYLWAVFLIKVAIILKGCFAVDLHFSSKVATSFFIAFFLIASLWHAELSKYDEAIIPNKCIFGGNNNSLPMIFGSDNMNHFFTIKKISEESGIHNVYGEDFWRMMPINTVLDNINAQALIYDGQHLVPYVWLSRPSWGSVPDNKTVLYFLKQGKVDRIIEERLLRNNGLKIFSDTKFSVWKGPRVWDYTPHSGYYEKHIDFSGDKFKLLPTRVGVKDVNGIATNGKSGFLVYGPYTPVQKGLYKLYVFGSIKKASGAYIEVVSQMGAKSHKKIYLRDSKNGIILKGENVEIPANLEDAEVRVWVIEKDEVVVSGYKLIPVSSIQ